MLAIRAAAHYGRGVRRAVAWAGWGVLGLLLLGVIVKTTVADVYRVGSGSMRPTIFGGPDPRTGAVHDEHVLVRFGGARKLQRFDLVVVRRDPELPMVKRVAGLPGESVGLAGGDLWIDGARLPLDAPRPAPIPVFDDEFHAIEEHFNFRQGPAGPWTRAGCEWVLSAEEVAVGSDGGMMLFQKDLLDDYVGVDGARIVGRREANDARLECEVRLERESGILRLRLVEAGDSFEGRIEVGADGRAFAVILRYNSGSLQDPENLRNRIEVLLRKEIAFAPEAWHALAFENLDNHLLFSVDSERLSADYEANASYPAPLPMGHTSVGARVAFGGESCRARFRRLRVLRDLCYIPLGDQAVGEPLVLGPDEYFVLGDNSSDSRDSRTFGPVRAEQIVGRPVMVVWPWGQRRVLQAATPRWP